MAFDEAEGGERIRELKAEMKGLAARMDQLTREAGLAETLDGEPRAKPRRWTGWDWPIPTWLMVPVAGFLTIAVALVSWLGAKGSVAFHASDQTLLYVAFGALALSGYLAILIELRGARRDPTSDGFWRALSAFLATIAGVAGIYKALAEAKSSAFLVLLFSSLPVVAAGWFLIGRPLRRTIRQERARMDGAPPSSP